jgi:hypothetical protein
VRKPLSSRNSFFRKAAFIDGLDRTRSPVRAMRRFADAEGAGLNNGTF